MQADRETGQAHTNNACEEKMAPEAYGSHSSATIFSLVMNRFMDRMNVVPLFRDRGCPKGTIYRNNGGARYPTGPTFHDIVPHTTTLSADKGLCPLENKKPRHSDKRTLRFRLQELLSLGPTKYFGGTYASNVSTTCLKFAGRLKNHDRDSTSSGSLGVSPPFQRSYSLVSPK